MKDAKREVFAVFSGGGTKGAAFVGAIEEALQRVKFVGYGGASAGSIIAALLACGIEGDQLRKCLRAAPQSDFFKINYWRLFQFSRYRGVVDSKPLLDWLREQTKKRKFESLADDRPLKIVATNVSQRKIKVYSKQNTPNEEIADAVLASCSFPFLFPPVRDHDDDIVDGGVLSNFPMWLFDDEKGPRGEFTPVLGFTVSGAPNASDERTLPAYIYSIFESILAAQDFVQDKYIGTPRLANVIRISTNLSTFDDASGIDRQDHLILAGKDAAVAYFNQVTAGYGTRVETPPLADTTDAMQMAISGKLTEAISAVARKHILHGGVARDDGQYSERVFVRNYVDLMEAVTDHEQLEVLTHVMAERLKLLEPFDRLVGIKKGNIILAYAVAQKMKKPFSVFKSDMSYKMGQPFDGDVHKNEKVVLVDDIASDISILLSPVRHLLAHQADIRGILTLIDRTEGDASSFFRKHDMNVNFHAICRVYDDLIDNLIYKNTPFPPST